MTHTQNASKISGYYLNKNITIKNNLPINFVSDYNQVLMLVYIVIIVVY